MIKAIFFDFDGVLVDSEKLHSDITIDYLHRTNMPIPDYEAYGVIGGNPKMNYWAGVYERYKDVIPCTYDELITGIRDAHKCLKEYDYSKIMFDDVPETLKILKEKGYLLALASSSAMDYLLKNLNSCGINDIFDFIISGRDITESKPSPQIYNKCVEHFGLQPNECAVIEDSTFGILAAKNAGLFTIAIKDYRFGMKQEKADAFADNLTEAMNILISMNDGYNDIYMEKYRIIETDIINAIQAGEFKPGEKLPGEIELCEKYNVSRVTVRKAILNLASAGKVYRRAGDGTYVSEKPYVNTTGQGRSFSEDMKQNGKVPGSILISFKISKAKTNDFIKEQLKLKANESFYEIVRLRTGDDIPIALSYAYIPFKMMPDFDIDRVTSSGSLYAYFKEQYKLDAVRKERTTSAVMPTKEQKKLLKISDEPLLKICHPSYTTSGEIFEYSETYYVGSRFIYTNVDQANISLG